jgi:hypothetical protein
VHAYFGIRHWDPIGEKWVPKSFKMTDYYMQDFIASFEGQVGNDNGNRALIVFPRSEIRFFSGDHTIVLGYDNSQHWPVSDWPEIDYIFFRYNGSEWTQAFIADGEVPPYLGPNNPFEDHNIFYTKTIADNPLTIKFTKDYIVAFNGKHHQYVYVYRWNEKDGVWQEKFKGSPYTDGKICESDKDGHGFKYPFYINDISAYPDFFYVRSKTGVSNSDPFAVPQKYYYNYRQNIKDFLTKPTPSTVAQPAINLKCDFSKDLFVSAGMPPDDIPEWPLGNITLRITCQAPGEFEEIKPCRTVQKVDVDPGKYPFTRAYEFSGEFELDPQNKICYFPKVIVTDGTGLKAGKTEFNFIPDFNTKLAGKLLEKNQFNFSGDIVSSERNFWNVKELSNGSAKSVYFPSDNATKKWTQS